MMEREQVNISHLQFLRWQLGASGHEIRPEARGNFAALIANSKRAENKNWILNFFDIL
jgi:hypothetical protein